jgi:hypothetical protein
MVSAFESIFVFFLTLLLKLNVRVCADCRVNVTPRVDVQHVHIFEEKVYCSRRKRPKVHGQKSLAVSRNQPDGMSLTKLSRAGNNFPARKSFISDIPAGDGKTATFFYSVSLSGSVCYHRIGNRRLHRSLIVCMVST